MVSICFIIGFICFNCSKCFIMGFICFNCFHLFCNGFHVLYNVVYVVYWLRMCFVLLFICCFDCPLCSELALSQLSLSPFPFCPELFGNGAQLQGVGHEFRCALSGCFGSHGSELPVAGFEHLGSEPHEHFGLPEHPQPPGAVHQGHL